MYEDFDDSDNKAKRESKRRGYEYVISLALDNSFAYDESTFSALPTRPRQIANRINHRLKNEHGNQLPQLIALAVWELWYSAASSAFYIEEFSEDNGGIFNADEYRLDPVEFAEDEGGAYTLWSHLAYIDEDTEDVLIRRELGIAERPNAADLLDCAALYYFARASSAALSNDFALAMNCLCEAGEACAFAEGLINFDAGLESAETSKEEVAISELRTKMARRAAAARHRENHALRDEIFKWMDENWNETTSLDEFAMKLAREVIPLKWRTIREHLTAWNKQRSAGKP